MSYPQQPGPGGYGYPPQGNGPPRPPYPQQPYPQQPPRPAGPVVMPNPERTRRSVGLGLWIVAMVIGVILNVFFQLAEIFMSKNPGKMAAAVSTGALFALVPLLFYIPIPAILDRYDPEPWWCLAMAFLWGAVVATGFAGFINTMVAIGTAKAMGQSASNFITPVICAPLCEEGFKGLAVLGAFYFLRREFDGVVDGIIYATFCALGFAAIENIDYYARAEMKNALGQTFVLRGVLAPWGHPLYTSMTGIGFGIARESSRTWVRVIAPFGGYLCGVLLHATWNFVATVVKDGRFFLGQLLLWFVFVAAFMIILIVLVVRKGRVIRTHLRDEVLLGNLTQEEVDLITSPIGRLRCTFSWRGKPGRLFIASGARLALSKWHTARAMKGQKRTVSADFIVPMRQELKRLRAELMTRMPRRA